MSDHDIVLNIGGLDPGHSMAEDLELPPANAIGAMAVCRRALDTAASARRGVIVSGHKGSGKSVGLAEAVEWFTGVERGKAEKDHTYRRRRVKVAPPLMRTSYRESAVIVAKTIDKKYTDRVRGQRKADPEICADIVSVCRTQNVAVLVFDEAEKYSADTLEFIRDLMAISEEAGRQGTKKKGAAAGVGIVVAGDSSVHDALAGSAEAMHRWLVAFDVPSVTGAAVAALLEDWFPGFKVHAEAVGRSTWVNYVSSAFGGTGQLNLRLVENVCRLYALHLTRSDHSIRTVEAIPFRTKVFEAALKDATWAVSDAPDASARASTVRLGRRAS